MPRASHEGCTELRLEVVGNQVPFSHVEAERPLVTAPLGRGGELLKGPPCGGIPLVLGQGEWRPLPRKVPNQGVVRLHENANLLFLFLLPLSACSQRLWH
jgi:hypothetical protein